MMKKLSAVLLALIVIIVPIIIYLTLSHVSEGWLRMIQIIHLTIEATIVTWILLSIFIPAFRVLLEARKERFPRRR
jgi:hypothetical protein